MSSPFSEKEIAKIKRQFLALDKDGCCNIPVSEIRSLLQNTKKMSEVDIRGLLTELDLDGNGTIDSCEFLVLLSNRKDKELKELIHQAITLRSPIRKSFREFDKNGDGHITKKEFRNVMKKQQGMVSTAQLDAMTKDADKNGDGKIEYDEFILVITNRLLMYNMYGVF